MTRSRCPKRSARREERSGADAAQARRTLHARRREEAVRGEALRAHNLLEDSQRSCLADGRSVNKFTVSDDDRVFTRASQILKECRGIEYSERGRRTPPRGGTTMQKEESRETPVPAEGVKTPQRPPQGRQPPSQPQTSHPRAEAQSKAHQGASYAAGARAKPQASKAGAMRQPAVP